MKRITFRTTFIITGLCIILNTCVWAMQDRRGTTRKDIQGSGRDMLLESVIPEVVMGEWRIESRVVPGGAILIPPEVNGILITNETHTVSISPLADQPDANLIFVASSQFTESGQTVQVLYETTSANSQFDDVKMNLPPLQATFSTSLEPAEEATFMAITGSDPDDYLSVDTVVRRLPGRPTEAYSGKQLIVIDSAYVDFYQQQDPQNGPLTLAQQTLPGAWQMQWRSLSDGTRLTSLFGFLVETTSLNIGLVPLATQPAVNLVYAAEHTYSGSTSSADLFYLTRSANGPKTSKVSTQNPVENFTFSTQLSSEEKSMLMAAGVDFAELSEYPVLIQRNHPMPTHVYWGPYMFIVTPILVDAYMAAPQPE